MEIAIVGYSSISIRKVIPSLLKINSIKKIHIFSRRILEKESLPFKNVEIFVIHLLRDLNEFSKSNKCLLFYISTENQLHFDLARTLLGHNNNVVIDKPAFISESEFNILLDLAIKNHCLISEALTWQFHKQLDHLFNHLDNYDKFCSIETSFTIPLPDQNTFRTNNTTGSGVFWDMCTYAISSYQLLGVNSFPEISFSQNIGTHKPQSFRISLKSPDKLFNGFFGFGFDYTNRLKVTTQDKVIKYQRIFTSECDKPCIVEINDNLKKELIEEIDDSFKNYLNFIINMIISNDFEFERNLLVDRYQTIFNLFEQ